MIKDVYVNYPEPDKLYRHYKGGLYKIISLATHTETGEKLVVYSSVLFGSVYVRPLSIWSSTVEGTLQDRFWLEE